MNKILSSTALLAAFALSGFFPAFAASPASLSIENLFGPDSEMTFRLNIKEIKESGFLKGLMDKNPEIVESIEENMENDGLEEFTDLTGFGFEDISEMGFSAIGVEAIMEAQAQGEEPKIGEDVTFVAAIRVDKPTDSKKLLGILFDKAEDEEGPEVRKQLEDSVEAFKGATLLNVPRELLEDEEVDADISIGIRSIGKETYFAVGLTGEVKRFFSGGKADANSSESLAALPAKRQIAFAMPIPPSVWEQAGIDFGDDNPLFAGLANAVKGIREVGFAAAFAEKSLGGNIAITCADPQSALALWTMAQAGLGMAQLALAGEGNAPPILNRIKTQAKGKSVIISVQVLPEDLDELGAFGPGAAFEADEEPDPEELIGEKAADLMLPVLGGGEFDLSEHVGKNIVVLDFWATWCGPCVKALPEVMKATDPLKNKGVVLVAVNQGEEAKPINKFLKRKKWKGLKVVLDNEELSSEAFMVSGIPQTVIIDKKGIVRHVHVGYSPNIGKRLRKELEAILAE
jgi:thiol-disulfide isomerase/thioredoxin